MKILIIGSKGFIGSNSLQYFCHENEVYGCDIIEDYNSERYFLIDASTPDFNSLFIANKFEAVINCSGAALVSDSFIHPRRDFELNTTNVYKILDAIRQYNPECKFLNLSSAAVYGTVESLPVVESQSLNPISPYGMHKLYAEEICYEFHRFYDLKTCNVRIFSAYGPGLRKQLFWELYRKCINSNKIELWGTGNETRDFIYIEDLVYVFDLLLKNALFNGEMINVGNGNEIKIETAARTFIENFNPTIEFSFNGKVKPGDPLNWVADIRHLKAIGYSPKFLLGKGIHKYCIWLNEQK